MAKENTVQLYGWVNALPKIKVTKDEDGEDLFVSGRIQMTVVRRSYATEDLLLRGKLMWDSPIVFSRNHRLIKHHLQEVDYGDMVLVRGTLCSKEVRKRYICPECGYNNVKENGVMIYIDPISVNIFQKKVAEDEAIELLKKSDEFSNDIKIIGTLCRDPQYYEAVENKKKECQFQIASNRLRHILEDGPEKRTDYPWVKVFGDKAKESYQALHTNSTIYIGGAVESREINQTIFGEECGTEFQKPANATEIIPYHIEYLNDCVLPDSTIETDEGDQSEE